MYIVMARDNYPDYYICDTRESAILFIRKTYTDNNQGNDFAEYWNDENDIAWDKYYEKHQYDNEILIINIDPSSINNKRVVTMEYLFERSL